jgi:hypothetical protein
LYVSVLVVEEVGRLCECVLLVLACPNINVDL